MLPWNYSLCTESLFSSLYILNVVDLTYSRASLTIHVFLSHTFISLSRGQRFISTTNWSSAFGFSGNIFNSAYSKPHSSFPPKLSSVLPIIIPVHRLAPLSFVSFLPRSHRAPPFLLYVSVIHLFPAVPVGLAHIGLLVSLSRITSFLICRFFIPASLPLGFFHFSLFCIPLGQAFNVNLLPIILSLNSLEIVQIH